MSMGHVLTILQISWLSERFSATAFREQRYVQTERATVVGDDSSHLGK
jgi:hypothetical protein